MTNAELLATLKDVRTFIEYARYELEPGEMQSGDQFPRQGCADKRLAKLTEAINALTVQPAPSGWQQRIAAMDPWYVPYHEEESACFFCGQYAPEVVNITHRADCLWQNAVDALPPAPAYTEDVIRMAWLAGGAESSNKMMRLVKRFAAENALPPAPEVKDGEA